MIQIIKRKVSIRRIFNKKYKTLKYLFRNTAKAPFTTTMLRSVGSGLTIGLAVGLPPLYYGLIRERVDIMDFLIEVPAVGVLFDNL